jgi:hypothetical protein
VPSHFKRSLLISVGGFMAQEDLYIIKSICTAKYIRNFPDYFLRKNTMLHSSLEQNCYI